VDVIVIYAVHSMWSVRKISALSAGKTVYVMSIIRIKRKLNVFSSLREVEQV
jgi:hypothetical protein